MERHNPDQPTTREGIARQMSDFGLDGQMIEGWLTSKSAHLRGQTPDEMIAQGQPEAVVRAMESYLGGEPASEFLGRQTNPDDTLPDNIIPFPSPDPDDN